QQIWHHDASGYYLGLFWSGMPDLNYANPAVTEAMLEVARYWLVEMNADGFRLDAIKHLIEAGRLTENTPATHDWLNGFYDFYKSVDPQALAVGEAWTSTQQVMDYTGDEVDIAFQFDLAAGLVNSAKVGIGSLFARPMAEVAAAFPPGQYATFTTNHDQDRLMSQLDGDVGAAKVAASYLLTAPGVPFIYYGEEIGMLGRKPDEDIRRPMQWSAAAGAGFTAGTAWRPPAQDYLARNVAAQTAEPDSLLSHYRALIGLRNRHPALRLGAWLPVEAEPGRVYACLRQLEGETLLVVINPGREAVSDYALNLAAGPLRGENLMTAVFGGQEVSKLPELTEAGGWRDYRPLDTLPPQSTFIWLFQPV
ncbi:MAG: alpha-amylase family glycosyl hydrolase, partial [Candidatus Promineifilaceae bacterium]